MAALFPIDFSQPLNTLGQVVQTERTNGIKIKTMNATKTKSTIKKLINNNNQLA